MSAVKLPAQTRRDEIITVCVNKDEKAQIIKAALARGLAPSVLIRKAALDALSKRETA